MKFQVGLTSWNFKPGWKSLYNWPLRIGKVQDKKIWKILKETSGVSIKTFCRKWEGETLPKWLSIFKQLKKCQVPNAKYPLARSNVPHFSTKNEICYHIGNSKLFKENLVFFITSKEIGIYFLKNTFISYTC